MYIIYIVTYIYIYIVTYIYIYIYSYYSYIYSYIQPKLKAYVLSIKSVQYLQSRAGYRIKETQDMLSLLY